MLILHDTDTILHETVELLGAKLIPAYESPHRIKAILSAIRQSSHELREVYVRSPFDLVQSSKETHNDKYLLHLETVFDDWLKIGLIEPSESVLPECFRFSTKAVPNPNNPPKDVYARAGFYAFDMSTGIMADTYRSVIASANLACEGSKLLATANNAQSDIENASLTGPGPTILALCRPPGHHCDGHRAGGYCYINNVAVAVTTFRNHFPTISNTGTPNNTQITSNTTTTTTTTTPRIGILDIDFHHGNGTQDIFYSDPSVLYVSIHGQDEFPYYTGSEAETGSGAGAGYNVNLPLPSGSSFEQYMEKLDVAIKKIQQYKSSEHLKIDNNDGSNGGSDGGGGMELLIISLGFDTFHLDPLGGFKIDTDNYETSARTIRQALRDVPCLIVLEGGYVVDRLGENLLSFLKGWEEA